MKYTSYLASMLALLMLILTSQCTSPKEDEHSADLEASAPTAEQLARDEAYTQVMAVHDEVMPKMNHMMKLKTELNKKKRAVLITEKDKIKIIEQAISDLEVADEAMMEWMRNFEPPKDSVPHQESMQYYAAQQIAVDNVKQVMLSAIAQAERLLESSTQDSIN